MTYLVVQVLGNSDILVEGESGFKQLEGSYSLEDIQHKTEWIEQYLIDNPSQIDFPLIQKLRNNQSSDSKLLFGFILTDQVRWIQNRQVSGDEWNNLATSDGIWWKTILLNWCESQNIDCSPIVLDVEPNLSYGVADWEGMAKAIDDLLDQFVLVKDRSIYFIKEGESIPIDKIIVQHSSGTPALSSALYLWGIEQKLAGNNIEFVYISEQETDCPPHSGNHWQWRLKVPQIRQLIAIQDFSGALALLDSGHPKYNELAESLSSLDRAVSLNLEGQNLAGRDSIIERIGIALWSEKAFRDRSQWMHWCLRIAGAFELALLLLVEQQSQGNYQWRDTKLIFTQAREKIEINRCPISVIVSYLLTTGNFDYNPSPKKKELIVHQLTVEPINESRWRDFKTFYIDHWQLEENPKNPLGLISIRNKLYHSLIGDKIDHLLDTKTKELTQVTHKEHPSQVAVEWLEYIIGLANLSDEIKSRSDRYRNLVLQIFNLL